ncbi:hypothetical protein CCACVL1_10001 [Corchorus capsularis]|uniref:Uncharacterized protein n=1 Tax=Corchorus capsularis TaxID=210143 RepID=A0A1R3ITE4_COCAP|nr:hypothetical protein CCACVL1_10001 [Corchorus capsularis]
MAHEEVNMTPIETDGEENDVQVISQDDSKIWSLEEEKILIECMSNPENNFPMPPIGKYYLVNSGYTNNLMFEEFGRDDLIIDEDETLRATTSQNHVEVNVTASQLQQMARVRDEIATQLWENSQNT